MRKPAISYRNLRPSNITSPQYRHLLLLLGWVVYFILYFLTENLIPAESCYPVHCWLDDVIPFCEWFVIPYVGWYVLIVVSLLYFAVYNVEAFKGLQKYIITTQLIAMACYIIFPTRQDLRPEVFVNDNVLTRLMGIIYAADTNTGVCPSLHVAYSMGLASAWVKERGIPRWFKACMVVLAALVCVATMFVKQHSAVDFFAALPVCLLAEIIAYGKDYWRPRWKAARANRANV